MCVLSASSGTEYVCSFGSVLPVWVSGWTLKKKKKLSGPFPEYLSQCDSGLSHHEDLSLTLVSERHPPFFFSQQNRSLCAVPVPPRKVDICRNCCALGLAVTMPPPTGAEQYRIRVSQRCLLALSLWKKGPSCYRAYPWVLLHSGRQSPRMLPSQGEVQSGRTEQLRGSVLSRSRWSMSMC